MECSNTWLTFAKKCVLLHCIHGISRCWYVHLGNLIALSISLVLANLCISTMGRWYCYYVGPWVSCDYGISYIVGVTWVIGCGGEFSCSAIVVLEMPFHHFHDTFKCVGVQFVSGAPLAHCDDHYKAQRMHWYTHLSPIPLGGNLQTFEGVHSSPTRGTNLCFLYEDQEIKKCVRSRWWLSGYVLSSSLETSS